MEKRRRKNVLKRQRLTLGDGGIQDGKEGGEGCKKKGYKEGDNTTSSGRSRKTLITNMISL